MNIIFLFTQNLYALNYDKKKDLCNVLTHFQLSIFLFRRKKKEKISFFKNKIKKKNLKNEKKLNLLKCSLRNIFN